MIGPTTYETPQPRTTPSLTLETAGARVSSCDVLMDSNHDLALRLPRIDLVVGLLELVERHDRVENGLPILLLDETRDSDQVRPAWLDEEPLGLPDGLAVRLRRVRVDTGRQLH